MAKKADLLAQAQAAGLKLSAKNTIAEIEAALSAQAAAATSKSKTKPPATDAKAKPAKTKASSTKAPATDAKAKLTKTKASSTKVPDAEASPDFSKAGKRSRKAVAAEQAAQAKQSRQGQPTKPAAKAKPKPAARPRWQRRGKKYQQAWQQIDSHKVYSQTEAIELAKASSITKFDGAVELHLKLNLDPRQSDQNIRAPVVLPAGSGRAVRVAVYAEADDIQKALKAGADLAGDQDLIDQLDKGQFDFDILITSPAMMASLSRYAKTLGPKGLMPNPKSGTVSNNLVKAIEQAKQGQVEYRLDEHGIVHLAIGRASFSPQQLADNLEAILDSIKAAKPASCKGNYIISSSLTTTMGPSIRFRIS